MKMYVNFKWDESEFEFSAIKSKIINSIKSKGIEDILPDEKKLINGNYESFFDRIDTEFGTQLYCEISDTLIALALLKGAHIKEVNPLRTKSIALD